ncbi:MAG: HEPN domain-containing protein [Firmicutes bacterium]|nr:HEPN domain-containing protein [Bacillota bacterium]
MGEEKIKRVPGLFDLLSPADLFWPFGKRKPRPKKGEASYCLRDAQKDWNMALEMYQKSQYDQATLLIRQALEKLLKANYPGLLGETIPSENNLLVLAKKVFPNLPAEVHDALAFLNPHYTLVRSVYDRDFADEVLEKARLIVNWILASSSACNSFDPDAVPPRGLSKRKNNLFKNSFKK